MRFLILCTVLALGLVTSSSAGSVQEIQAKALAHRSRRSVIKAIHSLWLSRRKRDVHVDKLIALRKRLTKVRRSLASGPPRVVKIELKFKRDWLRPMSSHDTAQYKLMDGNIIDALFTELIGDAEYIESKVLTLKSSTDKVAQVLGDIELHFDRNEEDPIKHLREIVFQTGRISGMEVYKDYFVIFRKSAKTAPKPPIKPGQLAEPASPVTAPTAQPTPVPPTTPFNGPYQEFQYDIKLRQPWDPKLSDYSSNTTEHLESHIKNLIKIIFDSVPNFVNDRVSSISNGPDEHPFVRILLLFKPGDNNPWDKMNKLVKSGMLGDIPIFNDYLNGQFPGTKLPAYNPPSNPRPTKNRVPVAPEGKTLTPLQPPPAAVYPAYPPPQADQTKQLNGSVKLDKTWYPFIGDGNGATHQILTHDLEQAIKDAYGKTPITVKVTELGRTPDNKIHASYTIGFPSTTEPTLKQLNDTIAQGYLGGIPVAATTPQISDAAPPPPAYPYTTPYNEAGQTSQVAPAAASASASAPAAASASAPAPAAAVAVAPSAAPAQPAPAPAVPPPPVPILPSTPPLLAYQGRVVPLPAGIPHSCEEIRSSGIGNQDGEYVILARPACHLNIICQNMEDFHPKEYLGGPEQRQWLYWHYAVLVKLSAHDKQTIDKRACLENTAVGREFISKVMAAGARQGNPLVPWKTNIKRMIHSYIGSRKKRRSLEEMDITLSTRAIKIYKMYFS